MHCSLKRETDQRREWQDSQPVSDTFSKSYSGLDSAWKAGSAIEVVQCELDVLIEDQVQAGHTDQRTG
eukprot:4680090-Amphidinium_carterae.1